MIDNDDIDRVIVEVKYLGKNSKELVYKHKRKRTNEKILRLQEIKKKLDDSNL
jgi:hypothetical protein